MLRPKNIHINQLKLKEVKMKKNNNVLIEKKYLTRKEAWLGVLLFFLCGFSLGFFIALLLLS